ncbi:cation-transporting P-type ATPase [Nitrosomonas sp. Nm34]|uniref:cation-translocating P-type ATPase n=1 Tax=Nitrosomonas sp. Nm34 TaxID=1881055 RepID=UPI0008E8C643|nr:cation-transporting P-type ATPase [Nitrosomonas sp. Nm34]SFJ00497.1 Ca2+-transporting ATPase [Nitrosomonas sp. Nm34]
MLRTVPIGRFDDILNSKRGLTQKEVDARLKQYGRNNIVEVPTSSRWALLLDTAKDPMLWFLLGMATLFIFLGDKVEAAILFVAAIPLIGMDLYLHRRTQASTEGLSSRLAVQANVIRDGEALEMAATELVPGDLVLLSAGENVPADGILIRGESIQVDESALTGEAYPVRKRPLGKLDQLIAPVPVDTVHWIHAGTRLLTGTATVRIVYTGAETIYADIVHSALLGSHERTPLQTAIANLVVMLLIAAIILCLALAWVRLRQGFDIVDAVLSAVTLAVAALPEEFPVVFTFFLGVGVYRLAQRRALVRRAVVVENIGRVSCICSDKTGTITEGQLSLTHRYPHNDVSDEQLLSVAAFASRSETDDPLDLAILHVAPPVLSHHSLVMTFPFTENRKCETAIWRKPDGALTVATKGAPEIIFAMCSFAENEQIKWETQVTELAKAGHKVIACAERGLTDSAWAGGEPSLDFGFAGLLAFEDPVREGVTEAIQNCHEGNIHVVMVTGDHPATAETTAREIGLGQGNPKVIEATQLDDLLQQGDAALMNVDVIARAVPSQKLSLVRGLQSAGEVVAVTGDGVNDVPALQAADIGIAMGQRGTRSAREVAAIVLLDDNFRTIIHAIAEGRQLFRNLKLSFAYLLMIHIPLVITAALIPLAGYPLLYLPVHIVWLELIIHPTALLVFQDLPANERLNTIQKTQHPRFFNQREWWVIAIVGALMTLMIIYGYERSLGIGYEVEHARAMALTTLSFVSAMLTLVLSGLSNFMSRIIVAATIALTLLLVQFPTLASLLHLAPLHLDDLMLSAVCALGIAMIVVLGRFRVQPH